MRNWSDKKSNYRFGMLVIGVLMVALGSGCASTPQLTAGDKAYLDSLDATSVVRTYFSSGRPEVELYLSRPEERQYRQAPNYVPDNERAGGVSNLTIKGGTSVEEGLPGVHGWEDVRQFTVEYVSSRTNSIGQPPGRRFFSCMSVALKKLVFGKYYLSEPDHRLAL